MIAWDMIVIAGGITGILAGIAAASVRWPTSTSVLAGIAAFASIVVWRAIANRAGLNEDFLSAISVGDCGSLVAGGIGPLTLARDELPARWLPAIAGGVVGFIANVVVL